MRVLDLMIPISSFQFRIFCDYVKCKNKICNRNILSDGYIWCLRDGEEDYSIFLVLGHRSYVCQAVFEITRQNKLRKCAYLKKSGLFCMKKGWVCSLGKKLVRNRVLYFCDYIFRCDRFLLRACKLVEIANSSSFRNQSFNSSPLSLSWSKIFPSVENS